MSATRGAARRGSRRPGLRTESSRLEDRRGFSRDRQLRIERLQNLMARWGRLWAAASVGRRPCCASCARAHRRVVVAGQVNQARLEIRDPGSRAHVSISCHPSSREGGLGGRSAWSSCARGTPPAARAACSPPCHIRDPSQRMPVHMLANPFLHQQRATRASRLPGDRTGVSDWGGGTRVAKQRAARQKIICILLLHCFPRVLRPGPPMSAASVPAPGTDGDRPGLCAVSCTLRSLAAFP